MNGVLKNLETMYNLQLYSNVVRVCELSITIFEHSPEYQTIGSKIYLYFYYADSLFNLYEYVHAESLFRKIIQMKKYLSKNKSAIKSSDFQIDAINDIEIKYKIYVCCMKQKQRQQALEILQSIHARQRTPKINMALATLYRDSGNERSASAAYKEVLREVPFALEAAENLLKMGVQGVEVNSLTLNAVTEVPWVGTWLKGQAELSSQDYTNAIATFKTLDTVHHLKENSSVLVNMAYCHNYLYQTHKAIYCLQRAVQAEPHLKTGRDLFSTLLANAEKEYHPYLEKLLLPAVDISLWTAEDFVVLGNHMFVNKKYDKALYFGHQAYIMDKRNVEALLLKIRTCMQNQKYQEAALQCVEAQTYNPRRFDIYKCLVECYIQMNRLRDADATASSACKQLNQSPQALTLHASVLMKDPINSSKFIKRLLEKAVATDPAYTPAVMLLAEQFEQEQQYEEAAQLLLKHVAMKPTSVLHQLIADNFARLQKEDDAFNHYCIALRLDPNNQKATEGLNNIGRSASANNRDGYYQSAGESSSYVSQGLSTSDHEPDAESDLEPWPTIDF